MPIVIIPMVPTTVLVTLDILAMDTHAVRFTAALLHYYYCKQTSWLC